MVYQIADRQVVEVFSEWSDEPDHNEVSGFFVGIGEVSDAVKEFFDPKNNDISAIQWTGHVGGEPWYTLSELMNGLVINDIVYIAFQHELNNEGLFFRPNELPPARAFLNQWFEYVGQLHQDWKWYIGIPAIQKFWVTFMNDNPFSSQRKLQDFAMVISLELITACQREISQGKNRWIPPENVKDWTPKYPTDEFAMEDPLLKELFLLWRTNYSGGLFSNSVDLFAQINTKNEKAYSIAVFMQKNPLPMVLNPGLVYKTLKWLGVVRTDDQRDLLLKHQWKAYVTWAAKNVYAMKRADENPDTLPYIPVGAQLTDSEGKLLFDDDGYPILNVIPDFGILDYGSSSTPTLFKIFGLGLYTLFGDNIWGFVRLIIDSTVKLIFMALDFIGKVISVLGPGLLALALGVGIFAITLTYLEDKVQTHPEGEPSNKPTT